MGGRLQCARNVFEELLRDRVPLVGLFIEVLFDSILFI